MSSPVSTRSKRSAFFDGSFVECPVYARDTLPVGFEIDGPAIIEEYDSTVTLAPGWRALVDPVASLVAERRRG